ncbi:MAG: hypothetical protein FWC40_06745 [Proteobacteria bacterium]|nr:hypothetical protein [Pseudomonadota bacterium]
MKRKTWLVAALMCMASASFVACKDDAGSNIKIDADEYHLACAAPSNCELQLKEGQAGKVRIQFSSRKDDMTNVVDKAALYVSTNSDLFTIQDGSSSTVTLVTNELGQAELNIVAKAEVEGEGQITVAVAEAYKADSIAFTIRVSKDGVIIVDPTEVDLDFKIKMTYEGGADLQSAEAMLFKSKSCADLVWSGMTSEEVANKISGAMSTTGFLDIPGTIEMKDFALKAKEKESEALSYAVVGRAREGRTHVAYGCIDGLSRSQLMGTIELGDAQITEIIDPLDPVDVNYAGRYNLTSSFDALSLLPKAPGIAAGKLPPFSAMLVGDWISWTLDFLADPEGMLPNILTQQILPLLLEAQWFSSIVQSLIPGLGGILTPEVVDMMLETFGIKQVLTDMLSQLTGQIEWWDDATSIVSIINQITKSFTLAGNFHIAAAEPNEAGMISGIGHNYDTLLYHNGSFQNCLIGSKYGNDNKGALICSVALKTLSDSSSTISGAYTAAFTGCVDEVGCSAATINSHSLQMAYGKLIYGVIMQVLPAIIQTEGAGNIKSIGTLLEYYIGEGMVAYWNRTATGSNVITGKHSCSAIAAVLAKTLQNALGGAMGIIVTMFANEATLAPLCTTGINAIDGMIDTQISKLTATSNAVAFSSSSPCQLHYRNVSTTSRVLASFGDTYVWGESTDKRCGWTMSIRINESTIQSVQGKFFAVRQGD